MLRRNRRGPDCKAHVGVLVGVAIDFLEVSRRDIEIPALHAVSSLLCAIRSALHAQVDTASSLLLLFKFAIMDSLAHIGLERINADDGRFSISYPAESPLLLQSVAWVGIIEPVLLLDGPAFTVISGFRRIAAARALGLTSVPAIVTAMSEKDALLRAIHGNVIRGLNPAEKASALAKMTGMDFPPEVVFGTMALLGLKAHEKVLNTFLALAGAGEALNLFVVSRNLSLTNIEGLMRFDEAERAGLLSLLTPIHTTEGFLREILRMAALLKLKEGRVDFEGLSGTQNADDLRRKLKARTYPKLTSMEERLEALRRKCALPPGVDIKVDPSFEKEYIDISIRARDVRDVEQALEKLRKTMEDGSLGSMLELTKA